jgi:hypothetical protein
MPYCALVSYLPFIRLTNVDILWTYLVLDDVASLREEEWRISRAREILKDAYGENNERLKQVKVLVLFACISHLIRMALALSW